MNRKSFSPRTMIGVILIMWVSSCGGSASSTQSPSSFATQQVIGTAPLPELTSTPEIPEQPEATPLPAIPEQRELTLEYPPKIRAGDSDVVRLTLEVKESGEITPTAVVQGNVVQGQRVEIPNLYSTHHVIVESRFDIAGLEVSPNGLSSQTLEPGQTVVFFWSVRPTEVGKYRGTVWLNLRFVDKVSGEESQRVVSAQPVEIEAVNLYGISANVVRTFGGVGSVVGAVVGFPFFEDIVKYLWSKRRKKRG
jgi:hypothetical protein